MVIDFTGIILHIAHLIFTTLPAYLLGFPIMTPLGISKKANLSVIYSSIYHIAGIGLLFIFGLLGLNPICISTITTEFLVLGLRVWYIWRVKR